MARRPAAVEATSEGQAAFEAAEGASSCKEVAVADTEGPGEACCEGQHQEQAASYQRCRNLVNVRYGESLGISFDSEKP